MLKFIIRLDDACEKMNLEKWNKVELVLDKYNIKPIVGIIPECKDSSFMYSDEEDFWDKYAKKWQEKNWIIAQHGLNHNLSKEVRTEYSGKSYDEQYNNIKKGYEIMMSKNINPICFFAPNHTYDKTTIKVCRDLGFFKFISDGYAFYPFKKNGMLHIPTVFDTPHVISKKGIFTFVYHPNNMNDNDFEYLEQFLSQYKDKFNIDINEIIEKYKDRKKNLFDIFLFVAIKTYRKIRNIRGKRHE